MMNFESLVKSITEIFSEEPDKPFKNDNVSTVFRHCLLYTSDAADE